MPDTQPTDERGTFKGNNEQLCNCIDALLDLNDDGAVSHRVPGMAVTLLDAARQRIAAAEAREAEKDATIARLRKALEWYANPRNWRTATVYMCGHSGSSNVTADEGKRARAALGEQP